MSTLSWYALTGTGYERGWWTNYKGRYRLYKGARNTKKSYDMLGLEALHKVISSPYRNILFLRNTFNSHRNSTYATMKMLIECPDHTRPDISLKRYFKFNDNEMKITYKPTGQVMLFMGCDDPQKIQGIRVVKGYLTDVYFEEAFELTDYDKWK